MRVDAIDRQEAIDTIMEDYEPDSFPDEYSDGYNDGLKSAKKSIESLPPIQPEYTALEKRFLMMLFKIADTIIESAYNVQLEEGFFDSWDLDRLAEKIGIDD